MSDLEGGFQKVLAQINDPWDWAAAAVGATVGAGGTLALHGADLGHSIVGGALAAIAGRKTLVAFGARAKLGSRAQGLIGIVEARVKGPNVSPAALAEYQSIWQSAQLELAFWQNDRTGPANDAFAKKIAELENRIRKNVALSGPSWMQPLPPPPSPMP